MELSSDTVFTACIAKLGGSEKDKNSEENHRWESSGIAICLGWTLLLNSKRLEEHFEFVMTSSQHWLRLSSIKMSSFIMKHMLTVVVVLLFTLLCQTVDAKVTVRVTNELGDGLNLTLHCRSSEDDLGIHYLGNLDAFQWHFNVNFWGTTTFICDFQWTNMAVTYVIFKRSRDKKMCGNTCFWYARLEGVCLVIPNPPAHKYCFEWPPHTPKGLEELQSGKIQGVGRETETELRVTFLD